MNSKEIQKSLNGQKNKIIELVRAEVDELSMLLSPLFSGAELLCAKNVYDFSVDGTKYIRLKFVTDIITADKNESLAFYNKIYKRENLLNDLSAPYRAENFRDLFDELVKSGEAVTVECNLEDAIDYYVGRVVSLNGNLATMECFDGGGVIFNEKIKVNLDFVSMVTVGDRYTATMAKYVEW